MPSQNPSNPIITRFAALGTSLWDRAGLYNKTVAGIPLMRYLSGINKTSPDGRFTNAFGMLDLFAAFLLEKFITKHLKEVKKWDDTDIADAIINGELKLKFNLDDPDLVGEFEEFRSYCEGGLTAWKWPLEMPTAFNQIAPLLARKAVSTLTDKRELLLADDIKLKISKEEKETTLIMEWTGENDLLTVNVEPTEDAANKVLQARIENIQKLYAAGYRNFVLCNMPDIALTPRYQNTKTEAERNAASKIVSDFNKNLENAIAALNAQGINVKCFDVNGLVSDAYQHPENYGFERAKLTEELTKDPNYKIITDENGDKTAPASGYLYFDDVHPSADAEALIATKLLAFVEANFNLVSPLANKFDNKKENKTSVQPPLSSSLPTSPKSRTQTHFVEGSTLDALDLAAPKPVNKHVNKEDTMKALVAEFKTAYLEDYNKQRANKLIGFCRRSKLNPLEKSKHKLPENYFDNLTLSQIFDHAYHHEAHPKKENRTLRVIRSLKWDTPYDNNNFDETKRECLNDALEAATAPLGEPNERSVLLKSRKPK